MDKDEHIKFMNFTNDEEYQKNTTIYMKLVVYFYQLILMDLFLDWQTSGLILYYLEMFR